tara:strand:- start:457 stop:1011 length:555 start_codon:yes stop_codon:yes gene_type:complete
MKTFTEFLTESKKTYEFKIGIAGDCPSECVQKMETALNKYRVLNLSSGKKTPIQERPLDFPQLQNMEVTYFEAEVEYPTTSQVLQEYLGNCCGVDQAYIIVRNANDPREEYQDPKADEPYDIKLTKEDMGGESAQESVGSNRVMELLKELETARKENEHDPVADTPAGESKDIGDTENNKAVIS